MKAPVTLRLLAAAEVMHLGPVNRTTVRSWQAAGWFYGKRGPPWKGPRTCAECSTVFVVHKWSARNQQYCSKRCGAFGRWRSDAKESS